VSIHLLSKIVLFLGALAFPICGYCEEPDSSLTTSQKLAALEAEKLSKKKLIEMYPQDPRDFACVLRRETDEELLIVCGEFGKNLNLAEDVLLVFNKSSKKIDIIPSM
jgi:hypothetical protein